MKGLGTIRTRLGTVCARLGTIRARLATVRARLAQVLKGVWPSMLIMGHLADSKRHVVACVNHTPTPQLDIKF